MKGPGGIAAAFLLFAVLATANAGGYRFGVSDQAYYAPAALALGDASLFPRDRALLEVQSRLSLSDDLLAWLSRVSGLDLPPLFLGLYVLTLGGLFAAGVLLARRLGLSWWAIAFLLMLMTLRHRIPRTGANTLEGYLHPRMLAFALGVVALALTVRLQVGWAALLVGGAGIVHATTALWFGLAIGLGLIIARPAIRRTALIAALPAGVLAIWVMAAGPLAGRLSVMDPAWLAVLDSRDYLLPTRWPPYAWILNLGYPVLLTVCHRDRLARGLVTDGERVIFAGLMALVAIFLISLPFVAARVAIAIQLQITRVFWLADVATAVYVSWWLMDRRLAGTRARSLALAAVAVFSIARGTYVLAAADRGTLVEPGLPRTAWTETMMWLRNQPADWHLLVDPAHAWTHGASARISARKDILLDESKDGAIATYDRDVAMRVADRSRALADFAHLTTAGARELRVRYAVDVLVAPARQAFDFPVLFRNAEFVVYDLR